MDPEKKIKEIKSWLSGPKEFDEGMNLLRQISYGANYRTVNGYTTLYDRTRKGNKSQVTQDKLIYLLESELKRLLPEIPQPSQPKTSNKEVKITSEEQEYFSNKENPIIKRIEAWFASPKDYKIGKALVQEIPEEIFEYLQLTEIETYGSRIRIYRSLTSAIKRLQDL
jgi:hypothetical protein